MKVVRLNTAADLKWIKHGHFARNLPKVLAAELKVKKNFHGNKKENLHFKQSRLNYINNQKRKQQGRTHKINNSLYWGRCGCKKPMMSFLSFILSKFIVTFYLFFLLCQRRSSCWKYWKWCSYFENPYYHAKIVEKKGINFLVSPYCTMLYSRKDIIKVLK